MSELRRDPLHRRWVVVAPERAERPSALLAGKAAPIESGPDPDCPFCPGHEAATPPEVHAVRAGPAAAPDGPGWAVRVVPNKYPALGGGWAAGPPPPPFGERRPGDGAHEVVIETPAHGHDWPDLSEAQLALVLATWQGRMRALAPGAEHVFVFKNRGAVAGATHTHPHSQVLALPVVVPAVATELEAMAAHRAKGGGCLVCAMVDGEAAAGERLVATAGGLMALVPYAARFPYELLVVPAHHPPRFTAAGAAELAAAASLLRSVVARLQRRLGGGVAYNVALHEAPAAATDYHWHLEVTPRVTTLGGFELGGGAVINPVAPESAAAELR